MTGSRALNPKQSIRASGLGLGPSVQVSVLRVLKRSGFGLTVYYRGLGF